MIDSFATRTLRDVAHMIRLRGAETVIVGIQPEVAFSMVKLGLTPLQAIQAATVNAADLIGHSELFGSITAGKSADIVAVQGDPLADIRVLEHVAFVMKEGTVYKHEQ